MKGIGKQSEGGEDFKEQGTKTSSDRSSSWQYGHDGGEISFYIQNDIQTMMNFKIIHKNGG